MPERSEILKNKSHEDEWTRSIIECYESMIERSSLEETDGYHTDSSGATLVKGGRILVPKGQVQREAEITRILRELATAKRLLFECRPWLKQLQDMSNLITELTPTQRAELELLLARIGGYVDETPRIMSRDQMFEGLMKGRKLRVDRRDAPELADLLEWEQQGLLESTLVEVDDQYSYLEFRKK